MQVLLNWFHYKIQILTQYCLTLPCHYNQTLALKTEYFSLMCKIISTTHKLDREIDNLVSKYRLTIYS